MSTMINIAEEFSRYPGGRYVGDGDGNGTTFRTKFLVPVLKRGGEAIIVLDGAAGYPSSFLEEAFGGLVRCEGFTADQVLRAFKFRATQPGFAQFVNMIRDYVLRAKPASEMAGAQPQ